MALNVPVHRIPVWLRSARHGVDPACMVRRSLGRGQRLRVRGVDVASGDMTTAWDVADDIFGRGTYDVPGFVPQAGWTVADIGGNVGLFAISAAARGARVTAYEPHPESARCLRRNTARWDVRVVEAAVTGKPSGDLRLYLTGERNTRNTLVGADLDTGTALKDWIDVPTITIADVLAEPVDLLKVDCEGAEFDIFAHGGEALANARRIIAEVHLHAGDPRRALEDVRAAGFHAALERRDPASPYLILTATRS